VGLKGDIPRLRFGFWLGLRFLRLLGFDLGSCAGATGLAGSGAGGAGVGSFGGVLAMAELYYQKS